jgi:transcriptional regulator with XRE-family HTH domain
MPESIMPPEFKDRLRERREARGMSQSELARAASLQPSAIAHFEAGRRKPSFDNVHALARALAVSADFLLGSKVATTAFRDEEKLTVKDRDFIQNLIDTMVDRKK